VAINTAKQHTNAAFISKLLTSSILASVEHYIHQNSSIINKQQLLSNSQLDYIIIHQSIVTNAGLGTRNFYFQHRKKI